jgi:hypothetical protein
MTAIPTSKTRLLVEMSPEFDEGELTTDVRSASGGMVFKMESSAISKARARRSTEQPESLWLKATPLTTTRQIHPWDVAHNFAAQPASVSSPPVQFVEPDFEQQFVYEPPIESARMFDFSTARACEIGEPNPNWATRPEFAWHLGDDFSQLASARSVVGLPTGNRVRVAILDTGFDPHHSTLPLNLLLELQRDFRDDDFDAADPGNSGLGDQPGHGTATLALLAGRKIKPPGVTPVFDDFIGGAPHAEIVPVRIANSVIHFWSSAMAEGIEYAVATGCRVVSISMGGIPTRRWAHAVNLAYEAGVTIIAAAGNNIRDGFPSREIVFPARFKRVIAVCGATADKTPYFKRGLNEMQGNFGPANKMNTAIAAYTPNTPWAEMGCGEIVSLRGAGTSSATPQVAAAAALWLQHQPAPAIFEPWQRVEAVRHALFSSADKAAVDNSKFFGQGLLRARSALEIPFSVAHEKTSKDRVWFPLLNLLTGFDRRSMVERRMLEVEAAQLAVTSRAIAEIFADHDISVSPELITVKDRRKIVTALRKHRSASQKFRDFIAEGKL